jgi:hypothetical protein
MGDGIEPGRKNSVRRQAICVTGEVSEGTLSDFLGGLGQANLAERDRIDQTEMPPHNFGEGILSLVLVVTGQQLQIAVAHLQIYITAKLKNPTGFDASSLD